MADIINDLEIVKRRIERLNGFGEEAEVIDDVISLLKEQEPRVMTLEEIEKSEIGFLEFTHEEDIMPALLIDVYADDTVGVITPDEDGEYWLPTNEYGKTWSCWSARPTDEQRKEAKWE